MDLSTDTQGYTDASAHTEAYGSTHAGAASAHTGPNPEACTLSHAEARWGHCGEHYAYTDCYPNACTRCRGCSRAN